MRNLDEELHHRIRDARSGTGTGLGERPSHRWSKRRAMTLRNLIEVGPTTQAVPLAAEGSRPLRPWMLKACMAAGDWVAILLATGVAIFLAPALRGRGLDTAREHLLLTVLSLPIWTVVFLRYGLYRTRHITDPLEEFRRVVHAVAASVLGLAAVGFLLRLWIARSWLLLFFASAVAVLSAERRLIRAVFGTLRRRGLLLRPVVIVGGNAEAIALSA